MGRKIYSRPLTKAITRAFEGVFGDFTPPEVAEVKEFITAGEYGVAFGILFGIVKEERKQVPPELLISTSRRYKYFQTNNLQISCRFRYWMPCI